MPNSASTDGKSYVQDQILRLALGSRIHKCPLAEKTVLIPSVKSDLLYVPTKLREKASLGSLGKTQRSCQSSTENSLQ